ncbi:hypothetical protein IAR50_006256 [Cryptococcus sp. DSM 104548]
MTTTSTTTPSSRPTAFKPTPTEIPTRGALSQFLQAHGERILHSNISLFRRTGLLSVKPVNETDQDGKTSRSIQIAGTSKVMESINGLSGLIGKAKKHEQDWTGIVRTYNNSQADLESALEECGLTEKERDRALDNIGYSVLHPFDFGVGPINKHISNACHSEAGSRASDFLSMLGSFIEDGDQIFHASVAIGRAGPLDILTRASNLSKAKAGMDPSARGARKIGLYKTNDDITDSNAVKTYELQPSKAFKRGGKTARKRSTQQSSRAPSRPQKSTLGYWSSSPSTCRSFTVSANAPYYPSAPSISGGWHESLGNFPSAPSLNSGIARTGHDDGTAVDFYPSSPSVRRPRLVSSGLPEQDEFGSATIWQSNSHVPAEVNVPEGRSLPITSSDTAFLDFTDSCSPISLRTFSPEPTKTWSVSYISEVDDDTPRLEVNHEPSCLMPDNSGKTMHEVLLERQAERDERLRDVQSGFEKQNEYIKTLLGE